MAYLVIVAAARDHRQPRRRHHLRRPRPTDPGERMTTTPPSDPQDRSETAVEEDRLENAIELKEVEGLSQGQIVRRRFLRHRGAMVAIVVLAFIVVLAATSIGWGPIPGWWIWDYTTPLPVVNGGAPTMTLPTWLGGPGFSLGEHPFGQDDIGRDIFARVMQGTQTSLTGHGHRRSHRHWPSASRSAPSPATTAGGSTTSSCASTDLVITIPVIVIGCRARQDGGRLERRAARDRARSDLVDRPRPARARRVPHPARARVRRRRAGGRGERPAHHLQAHPAQRHRRDHREHHAAHERGDPARDRTELPRLRHHRAERLARQAHQRVPERLRHASLAVLVARLLHHRRSRCASTSSATACATRSTRGRSASRRSGRWTAPHGGRAPGWVPREAGRQPGLTRGRCRARPTSRARSGWRSCRRAR